LASGKVRQIVAGAFPPLYPRQAAAEKGVTVSGPPHRRRKFENIRKSMVTNR